MQISPGAEPRTLSPFVPGNGDAPVGDVPSHWFLFREGKLLVAGAADEFSPPVAVPFAAGLAALGLHPRRVHLLGTAAGSPCLAAEVPAADPVPAR
jgi:hypothetical protein